MNIIKTSPVTIILTLSAMACTCVSLHASDTDDRIESSFKKSYVSKTYLKGDSIKLESENGVVELTGTVSDSSHKSLAQDTVEGLPGVKSVDNKLTIKGEVPEEHSDSWITWKLKTALLFHRHVSASGTDVYVKDGVVYLRGEAATEAAKELTAEYAKDIDNVKSVKNEMTIAKTPPTTGETIGDKIDDASITAQVKATLIAHHSTSAIRTKVETTEGVVTISGIARNETEKTLVTKLVTDVNGVVSVINNMTVTVASASNK